MFTALSLVAAFALPQGDLAQAPVGLTIVVVDVGQGDGIVVRAPDGTIHVIDAGPEGEGTASMLPVIDALQPQAYGYAVLSHFHVDHGGGLDDVLARPFQVAYDRGDVNRPSNTSINSYVAVAGSRRHTIAVGGLYQLGGGATLRCIAANGSVMGGAFVDPTNSSEEENSRSIALRLDYGDFSMWLGGDLTGGGNTTADVESSATLACGDVDVYKINHHGSNTSTSLNLVARLDPELAVVSCGAGNSYGHPTTGTVNRLNQAAAARALLSTTTGSAATIGFGVAGNVRIDTDGYRYRATAQNGDFLDFFCDEVVPEPLAPGAVRISEILRDPNIVPDTNGEYVEVVNIGPKPIALAGLMLSDNAANVVLAANYMAVPGRPMLFQVDGAPSRNGGQPLGVSLPFSTLSLANSNDTVTVSSGATILDTVTYTASLPGGAGIAAERRDLFAPHQLAGVWNYAAAPLAFGAGDRGSPGRSNDSDTTVHPVQCGVTVRPGRLTLHATALDHGSFYFSLLALSYGTSPGIPFGGAVVPLNFDALFQVSLSAPGFLTVMPAGGYRSVDVVLPQPNPIAGVPLYAAHVILAVDLTVPGVSPAVPFVTQ